MQDEARRSRNTSTRPATSTVSSMLLRPYTCSTQSLVFAPRLHGGLAYGPAGDARAWRAIPAASVRLSTEKRASLLYAPGSKGFRPPLILFRGSPLRRVSDRSREVLLTPPFSRLAFIGNSLPRRCGIATFTTDLQQAISKSRADVQTTIVAMTDHNHLYEYPPVVRRQIHDDRMEEYAAAADFLNAGQFEFVSLQHEFGIFGGDAGGHIMTLLSRLTMPIVTTLHTVLSEPTAAQRAVLNRIIDVSSKVIIMAEKGRELLMGVYGVPSDTIELIPHGVPDYPFGAPDVGKVKLGFGGKTIILTFGLL